MKSPILGTVPLATPWQTLDPFLFCMHHLDAYPEGDERMAPKASLAGRNLGSDFSGRDGWSMYHGQSVPGFPQHPHRGFETITIVRSGYIDHSDSLGATARFGHGDVQWMTAGKGIVHAEMFPLVNDDAPNPVELFQIWLNLPAEDKLVDPYFTMLWGPTIPRTQVEDEAGRTTEVVVVAGTLLGLQGPQPPPDSWANRADAEVGIWTLKLDPGARWTLPAGPKAVTRVAYFFAGRTLTMGGQEVAVGHAAQLDPTVAAAIENGEETAEIVVLQGRPIGEPVARHGPFVMNSAQEIQQAYSDYRSTGFGGWPWEGSGPTHERDATAFAVHADGRKERRG